LQQFGIMCSLITSLSLALRQRSAEQEEA